MKHLNSVLIEGVVTIAPRRVCGDIEMWVESEWQGFIDGIPAEHKVGTAVVLSDKLGIKAMDVITKGMIVRCVGRLSQTENGILEVIAEHLEYCQSKGVEVIAAD